MPKWSFKGAGVHDTDYDKQTSRLNLLITQVS